MVPVLVVDRWRTFAEAMTAGLALATDIMVVDIAVDVESAAQLVRELAPLVIVVNREFAAALLAEIADEVDRGAARVVVLAEPEGEDDESDAGNLVRAGCAGWIRRDASVDLLVESVRAVARDETLLPPDVIARAMRASTSVREDSARGRLLAKLTPRQSEILVLMESGMGRREIAHALGISRGSVRTHVQRITARLNVRSAREAVSMLERRD